MILIVILYAIFASTFTLGKLVLVYTQPIFLVGIRMSIAGLMLLAYRFNYARANGLLSRKYLGFYIQTILFTVYFPYLLRSWALLYLPSSKASLLYTVAPFVSYIFSFMFNIERFAWQKLLGIVIGFCGMMPMLLGQSSSSVSCIAIFSLPSLAIVVGVCAQSYGWIVMRTLIKELECCPIVINAISMLGGGIIALITSGIMERNTVYVTDFVPFITMLGIIIVVSNLICHNLYATLLKKYTPTMLAFASFLSPLFASLYGWLFMNEVVGWQFYATIIMVLIGLVIFYCQELKEASLNRSPA